MYNFLFENELQYPGLGNGRRAVLGVGVQNLPKHLLLIAGIILLTELVHNITLHLAIYFSIVLRKACCASLDNLSASERKRCQHYSRDARDGFCVD